jgi:hypothetical protein
LRITDSEDCALIAIIENFCIEVNDKADPSQLRSRAVNKPPNGGSEHYCRRRHRCWTDGPYWWRP